jgi:hypothetical protein
MELLRLGLQVLEFLLNEVCQSFAHLHLQTRRGLACTPHGPWPRCPGSQRGLGGLRTALGSQGGNSQLTCSLPGAAQAQAVH